MKFISLNELRPWRQPANRRDTVTGRIVHRPMPVERHACTPPQHPDLEPPERPNPSRTRDAVCGSHWEPGTVWECDCGRTWVTGRGAWRPESRFARWHRERQHPTGEENQ